MPNSTQSQTIFAIYAEDKKGLIGQILVYFNRKNYEVSTINVSRTDISDLVLITLEAGVPEDHIKPFTERLKKIIEVHAVTIFGGGHLLKKTGFYRMALPALNNDLWQLIGRYGAQLSSMGKETFVINKTGSDKDLTELYIKLEGQHLLGFCKSGLIVEESLMPFDEI
jgi:acetolactate synthase-1/3 small subunit